MKKIEKDELRKKLKEDNDHKYHVLTINGISKKIDRIDSDSHVSYDSSEKEQKLQINKIDYNYGFSSQSDKDIKVAKEF